MSKQNKVSISDFFVVMASDRSVAEKIAEKLADKLDERTIVWGKDEGYCAWCVDGECPEPKWEYATDSQGDQVKYACCNQCADERGVKGVEE